jgi:DNA-binding response OmpR family regulator
MSAETILLVDDEETDRSVVRRILEPNGYRILEADTYRRALDVFEVHRDSIALLVTDISLPGGNGCELWVAMRKQNAELRVLFVSGHVGAEVLRFYGLKPSTLHFFTKPFTADDLRTRITEVLRSSESPELHDPYWQGKVNGNGIGDGNGR